MRLINKPGMTHEEVLRSCINNINDLSLRTNVESELSFFIESSIEYDKKATEGKLSEILQHELVNNVIDTKEMKFLYNKLLTKGIPARTYYDKILHGSKMCPFCSCRPSKTLDHYLPKSKYPTFAVDPLNLIPCCRDCNSIKLVDVPTEEEETLHPYYDNTDSERWLYAEVEEVKEVGFKFLVKKPDSWSEKYYKKVSHHFNTFELSNIFSIYASSELGEQAYHLKNLFNLGGPQIVKDQLLEYHRSSQKPHLNNWKSAMFEALARNEWFCSEGIENYYI